MITPTRERRDWTLLVFIIPIGIILMLIAGQIAVRLVPEWSVNAGMQSNLDPNNLPMQQSGLVQPILPAILTPFGWLDTFLTPGSDTDDVVFPPFITFEPSVTPVVTDPPPTVVTTQPPPTLPTDTPIVTASPPITPTKKPTDEPPSKTPTATQPTPTQPTPTPTGTPSTLPTFPYIEDSPTPPVDVNVTPDGNASDLVPGTYTVVNINGNPIVVSGTPDGNYDLIFYEALNPADGTEILLDNIVIGISQDGITYYVVFNWGDDNPDTNTNIDSTLQPEDDNTPIPISDLYENGVFPQTGILIDVDTAPAAPPEGTYTYIVILSPPSTDAAQVDSIVVDEVPIASVSPAPVAPLNNAPPPPADQAPAEPASEAPSPPENNDPVPPAEEPPASPVEELPATP